MSIYNYVFLLCTVDQVVEALSPIFGYTKHGFTDVLFYGKS